MTINELRAKTGFSRKQFADYFGIPYRTVEDWERWPEQCKDYMVRALYYQLLYNGVISKDENEEK